MAKTEYASPGRRGLSAHGSLAERTGKSLAEIVKLAEEDRLFELFDDNGFIGRPRSATEALRRIEQRKTGTISPGLAMLRLRKRAASWAEEERRGRDPLARLAELEAKRARW
jgi:hypothetical protein